jgi:hypothetical protein
MKRLFALPLFVLVLSLTGCPKPEVLARDGIAAAHGYVVYGQTEWLLECKGNPLQSKCVLINRLIVAEHITADALAIYCSGTPLNGIAPYAQGGPCEPVKTAMPALQASLVNIQDLVTQIRAFLPAGTKIAPSAIAPQSIKSTPIPTGVI